MIIATLTNSDGCDFDSVTLPDSRGLNRKKAAIAAAKRWATGCGGRYVLNVHEAEEIAGHVWTTTLGEWSYSGSARRGVAI